MSSQFPRRRQRPRRRTKSATLQSDAVVERLRGLHPSLIDLSLDRTFRLLRDLGDPQNKLPCPVHVAGTNGKGSFLAFLRAIAEAAGLTVHLYTSPHLVQFAERIVAGGKRQTDPELVRLLEECEAANGGQEITFFEVTTAAAFLAFSRTPADITLIETGLGGRFDATNVIDKPALTAITPVGMDHMRFLGDTLAEIAFEKAGILKPGVEAVIAEQDPGAMEVIEKRAAEIGAPLTVYGHSWRFEQSPDGFSLYDGEEAIALPSPTLIGPHQIANAAQAATAARRLPFEISDAHIADGISRAVWPGRMQPITKGALHDLLQKGWQLWLDGGHNPAAAEILADIMSGWREKPVCLIFGALSARDPAEFLEIAGRRADRVICVAIPGEESTLSAEDALAAARATGCTADAAPSLEAAMKRAGEGFETAGRILVCGSLYLAGAFLSQNKTPP